MTDDNILIFAKMQFINFMNEKKANEGTRLFKYRFPSAI